MKLILTLSALLFVFSGFASQAADRSIAPLTSVSVNGNDILADAGGRVLYTYDPDQPNLSNCSGGCAADWPPLSLALRISIEDPLARISRADGTTQITYETKPLYYFSGDDKSGVANGDGLGGIWHVIPQ